jgi:hypothetical protein
MNGEQQRPQQEQSRWDQPLPNIPSPPPADPIAVELPAEDVIPQSYQRNQSQLLKPSGFQQRRSSEQEKIILSSDEYPQPVSSDVTSRHSGELTSPHRRSNEQFTSEPHSSNASVSHSPRRSGEETRVNDEQRTAPPRPPKTPIQRDVKPAMQGTMPRPPAGTVLPYPDNDGPPPVVNMARKPEYGVR